MTDGEEIDEKEWQAAWRQMEVRDFPDAVGADFKRWFGYDYGRPLSATISSVPTEYRERLYFPTDICPVCRNLTVGEAGVRAANLGIDFERVQHLGCSIWIHEQCFQQLPMSAKPPPIPW